MAMAMAHNTLDLDLDNIVRITVGPCPKDPKNMLILAAMKRLQQRFPSHGSSGCAPKRVLRFLLVLRL